MNQSPAPSSDDSGHGPAASPIPTPSTGRFNRLRPLLWLVLGCLMLAIPLSMAARKEYVLRHGQTLRFRLAPVDPYDPYRGRFMALNFEVEDKDYTLPAELKEDGAENRKVYVRLSVDDEGYARIDDILAYQPDCDLWLVVELRGRGKFFGWGANRVVMPFKRYYLNEDSAKAVEDEARDLLVQARRDKKPCPVHAVVRLKDGEGIITELRGPKGPLRGKPTP